MCLGTHQPGHASCALGLPSINHPAEGEGGSQENIRESLEIDLVNCVGNFMVPHGLAASRACPLGQAPQPRKENTARPEQGPPRAGPPDGGPVAQL